jgi:hypothetical protein
MKYLVVQNWRNTSKNHTGMLHLGKLILRESPSDYKLIVIPDIILWVNSKWFMKLQFILQPYFYSSYYIFIGFWLSLKLKSGDKIFLMEYLLKERNQFMLARVLKLIKRENIEIHALPHLTPSRLDLMFGEKKIQRYCKFVDNIFTLGSSLSNFLIEKGIDERKIKTTFHYVDNNFYRVLNIFPNHDKNKRLKVIIMGMQMRDYNFLNRIIETLHEVDFIIYSGLDNGLFRLASNTNVVVKKFVPENELFMDMQLSDVSLSLLKDTVGSNVIVSSMAMGLINVVSEVGSIKDYCTSDESFLCTNFDEFYNAIKILDNNRLHLYEMRIKSLEKSKIFGFDYFFNFINNL